MAASAEVLNRRKPNNSTQIRYQRESKDAKELVVAAAYVSGVSTEKQSKAAADSPSMHTVNGLTVQSLPVYTPSK